MSNVIERKTHGKDPARVDRIHRYCLARMMALTAIRLIHDYVFTTKAQQQATGDRNIDSNTSGFGIQECTLIYNDNEFLTYLEFFHENLRELSFDRVLQTKGTILWSDLMQAIRSGEKIRDHARMLCEWLEANFHINLEHVLYLDADMKILIIGGEVYDADRRYVACQILEYYYNHNERPVGPKEIWIRLLDSKGKVDRVKDIFETLSPDLIQLVKPLGAVGRIWRG